MAKRSSQQFTLQGTNTYIVGTGRERLIIDTGQGIPEWTELISKTLSSLDVSLSYIFLSHWHGDHSGGVPDLLHLYPHLSRAIYKNSPGKGQNPIFDGQVFKVEGASIQAVHSQGHSHDHMCFILEEENAMFTGDNVLGHGSSAVEDLSTYMTTLYKMESSHCGVGYPAHGAVIKNLPSKISSEISAKVRREKQVLQALTASRQQMCMGPKHKGSMILEDLVTAIYGADIDDEVRTMALEPFVEEVLRKLASDGTVAFELRAGQKKWYSLAMNANVTTECHT